jgi:hypothetical protein
VQDLEHSEAETDSEPINEDAIIAAANVCLELGDEESAIDILNKGLEAVPDSANIIAMLESLGVEVTSEPASTETTPQEVIETTSTDFELPGMPGNFIFTSGTYGWYTELN